MVVAREHLWKTYNPPVTASPCHPPLHKGGFGAPLGQQGEPLRFAVSSRNILGIATPVCGLVRNDMRCSGLVRNDILNV